MKLTKISVIILSLLLVFSACGKTSDTESDYDAVEIVLNDEKILVDGEAASVEPSGAVYVANDIVYYESGKDFTYGEGTEKDAHTKEEADAHTVVHIAQPGVYSISGKLSKGQVAIDLGEEAKVDPEAKVTLILNGVDITSEVAPAVIFYNVYECGNADTEKASYNVDASLSGANVIIADGTVNNINGSYVEKIYKADTVVLNKDGTEVEDAKKLHKYDGAFYSKMSLNITGEKDGSGVLNIRAENEGLDSELHLTINGGNININSGNDGINTNEDGVSVTTVNAGNLNITVTGETGEGDGIDSNGWLVINGGKVVASACSVSGDAGIDSDMGIHIKGGTVIASGNMLDRIENGGQTYAVFNFAQKQSGKETVSLKDSNGKTVSDITVKNDYSILIYSSPDLKEDTYSLWSGEKQLAGQSGGMMNMRPGGFKPEDENSGDMTRPEPPEGQEMPVRPEKPQGEDFPDGQEMPTGEMPSGNFNFPEGAEPPEKPEGGMEKGEGFDNIQGELTPEFKIVNGGNMFNGVSEYIG